MIPRAALAGTVAASVLAAARVQANSASQTPAAASAYEDIVVESFEGPDPLPVQCDSGQVLFYRGRNKPRSGGSCLGVSFRSDRPARLRIPLITTGAETHLRLWIRCTTAETGARVQLGVEDSGGRRAIAAPQALQPGAAWLPLELGLSAFRAEAPGHGKVDLTRLDWLLLECAGAPLVFDLDDVTVVGERLKSRRPQGLERRESELRFDNTASGTDWWAALAAQYDPFQLMTEGTSPNLGRRGMNDSWWTVERERVKKMGLQAVRMWFQIDWWEPLNDDDDPGHWAPDYSGFATDGPRMRAVYAFLDLCQEAGIEVCLNFGWKMDLPARNWLATPETRERENPDVADAAEHAESLVSLLRYLHDVKGYTVVTHIALGNELEYNYPILYPAVHERLVAAGLRDRYVLAGMETNTRIDYSVQFARTHPGLLDVHTLHRNHEQTYRGLARADRHAGRVHYSEILLGRAPGLDIADAVVTFAEEGAYGVGGWRLADQHLVSPIEKSDGTDNFDHGLHQWGTWEWIPWMRRPRESYYAASVITRYTRARSRVLALGNAAMHDKLRAVCFAKDGEYSILVLNRDARARGVQVALRQPVSKTFHRHLFAPGRLPAGIVDTVIPSDATFSSSTFRDSLPAESFAVYTTFPDWPQIEVSPPVAVASPGATLRFTARPIATKGRINWSVDGGAANGTVTSAGVYVAPQALPAIDPVIVRATGADARAVGLAVVSMSGALEAPPSRPTVVTGRTSAPRGGSRIFDLGVLAGDDVREFDFKMINYGAEPAGFAIEPSSPWMRVAPATGTVPPGAADSVAVKVSVDAHGLAAGRGYRGTLAVRSPRQLGLEVLDVFFKTQASVPPDPQRATQRGR